jgi:putative aminopeptidase FrvX
MRKRPFFISLSVFILFSFLQAGAPVEKQTLEEIFKTPSPTGYEENMIQKIIKLLPDGLTAERDGIGSLYTAWGEGGDRLALVTGIDEIGYVVSGFEDGGYLHLFRAVSAPHELYDSFQFGHPMTIWTEKGPVAGVLTLPSLHIASREIRSDLQSLFVIENALVDIGVGSAADAKEKGVAILDPVTPLARITVLAGQQKSGPSLGTKVCTSVLVELVGHMQSVTAANPATFVWLAQSKFPARRSRPRAALGAVVARKKIAASGYLIVDTYPVDPQAENGISIGFGPVLVTAGGENSALGDKILKHAASENLPLQQMVNTNSMIFNAFLSEGNAAGLFIPLKFPATPNEIVDFRDVEILMKLISFLLQ